MKKLITVLSLLLGLCVTRSSRAATIDPSFPAIIRKGLQEYERGGATLAFYAWQKGGLLEDDTGAPAKLRAFQSTLEAFGTCRSAEKILTKRVGQSTQILYAALNCKRGAVYMKFWLYRGEADWVVQNFVYSIRPESVMPWLAVESEVNTQEQ